MDSSVLQLISSLTQGVDDKHAAILQQSATSVEGIVSPDTSEGLKGKVLASVRQLAKGLLERETEVGRRISDRHAARPGVAGPPLLSFCFHHFFIHCAEACEAMTCASLLTFWLLALAWRMQHGSMPAGPPDAAGSFVRRASAAAGSPWHSQVGAEPPPEQADHRHIL